MDKSKLQNSSIPWETVLELTSHLLPPETIAISSCVSKSWNSFLSSSHIWKRHLISKYPSLISDDDSSTSPHRLYSLLQSRRRNRKPCALRIGLEDIFFMVDIFGQNDSVILSFIVRGDDLAGKYRDRCGLFLFDVEAEEDDVVGGRNVGITRVVWNVVMEGWRGCFLMMDHRSCCTAGKGKDHRSWFMEELPGPACCGFKGKGGLVGKVEVRVGECEGGGWRVEGVSLGLMVAEEWRYCRIEHALLYLQDFLM